MFSTPDQITEFNKTALEAVLGFAKISFDATERLIGLNMEAGKEAFAEATKTAKTLVDVKDVQDLMGMRTKFTEGGVEKVMEYSRSIYEVTQHTQAQMSALVEGHTAEFQKSVAANIEKAVKSAPAGADVAIAAVKSSVAATAAAMDSLTKAAKQVSSFADASMKATSEATTAAVKTSKAK